MNLAAVMFVTKSLPQLVGSLMTKAEIPFYSLPRLLEFGYMFFDFWVWGQGKGPRDNFLAFFGGGREETPLTRRLPLFFSSYYLVSLLSASLMFLATLKIAKKFSCTSLLSKQEHTFKRCSVASTKLEILRITSL